MQLDQTYLPTEGSPLKKIKPTMLLLQVKKEVLQNFKKLIIIPETGTPSVLDIPAAIPSPPSPALDPAQAKPQAKKGSSPSVEFRGKDLGAIQKAWFEGKELPVKPSSDGASVTIFLSRDVTKELGPAVILLEGPGGSRIPAEVVIIANP